MAETHTSYAGRLIRLSDEPVGDFVADVNMVRALYNGAGFSEDGLRRHVDELDVIETNLLTGITESEDGRSNGMLWKKLVELSLTPSDSGRRLIDAYSYMRVNRFLSVEYGDAETEAVVVLRGIATEVIEKRLASDSKDKIVSFFSDSFATDLIDAIYPPFDSDDLRPEIVDLVNRARRLSGAPDPALARVISTLLYRSNELVINMPADQRAQLMKSLPRQSNAAKPLRELVLKDSIVALGEDDATQTVQTGEEQVVKDGTKLKISTSVSKFDRKRGDCYVPADDDLTPELHFAMQRSMNETMFPNDGKGVAEAQNVCKNCPIKTECLDYALAFRIENGIWGGESERSRRRILEEMTTDLTGEE